MIIQVNQTHHTVGDFFQIFKFLKEKLSEDVSGPTLSLYPELYLTGYSLQDLVIQKDFISTYERFFKELTKFCLALKKKDHSHLSLVGGLHYEFDEDGLPLVIENVIYALRPGKAPEKIYTKALLPNYDIFDEMKYFKARQNPLILEFEGLHIAPMICEDMWFTSLHDYDPTTALYQLAQKEQKKIDLVVNLSASPYFLGKHQSRIQRAQEIAGLFECPFVYVNQVGGEDEVQFDGSSFLVDGKEVVHQFKRFEADSTSTTLPKYAGGKSSGSPEKVKNTWESLFKANLDMSSTPPQVPKLTDKDCEFLIYTMGQGLKDYAKKCGFNRFLIALSGGIDSALVLALCQIILGKENSQNIEAIYMPGHYSDPLSWELSTQMCQKAGIKLTTFPIKFLHSTIRHNFRDHFKTELEGLSDENIQSRLRGTLLYARSNQTNALVINTSNKSELAVGYSTLYGDSVGGISLLGDLYKTEVYELSHYINRNYDNLIPEGIITREPSAELRENQKDSESLPTYERLDAILEGVLSYRHDPKELISFGFDEAEVNKIYKLYKNSEYKRRQFAPIIKLRAKSFGFGYRMPIAKNVSFES